MKFFENKKISNHPLARNLFALVVLQGANYLFPLLAFPVLAKFLGVTGFGEFMVILAIITMAMIFTDFGFNLSATHTISLERENREKIAQLVGNVFFIKIVLALISIVVVMIYIRYEDNLQHLSLISLVLISLTILAQSLQCVWFFQGIEKMKNITIATISSKVIYLILLCILLPFWSNVEIAILCFGISQTIMIMIYINAIYKEGYSIAAPKFSMLIRELKFSFGFFISRLATTTYSTINTIVIGSVNGSGVAGLYSSAEKLYTAGVGASGVLSQAMYPYMVKSNNVKLLIKLVGSFAIPYFLGCFILREFSSEIMELFFGESFIQGAVYLELFLLLLCISFLSMNLGYPGFAAIKKVEYANYTIIMGASVHILGLLVLYYTNQISAMNLLLLVIFTESLILILMISFLLYFNAKNHKYDANVS